MTIIYGVKFPSAELIWYNHLLEGNQQCFNEYVNCEQWANGGHGKPIGSYGWNIFNHVVEKFEGGRIFWGCYGSPDVIWKRPVVCSNGDGIIYGVTPEGVLKWYNHIGYANGGNNWHKKSGDPVRADWGGIIQIFGAGNGVIYTTLTDGRLLWWRHEDIENGSNKWHADSGTQVGKGWKNVFAFSGGSGIIYGVKDDGALYWFKHKGYLGEEHGFEKNWENGGVGKPIGIGWHGYGSPKVYYLFAGPHGQIYALDGNGTLIYYKHEGYATGEDKWLYRGGTPIGTGWSVFYAFGISESPRFLPIYPPESHYGPL